jgi:hypothetical protein
MIENNTVLKIVAWRELMFLLLAMKISTHVVGQCIIVALSCDVVQMVFSCEHGKTDIGTIVLWRGTYAPAELFGHNSVRSKMDFNQGLEVLKRGSAQWDE